MFVQVLKSKGRFGALFRTCLTLARVIAGVLCAIMFLPFVILLGLVGFDAAFGGEGWGMSLGALLCTWALGGLFGLIGYLVAALGWARQFNELCRWRLATTFALAWGCASAAPLVAPELYSGLGSIEPTLWLLTFIWLDSIGLLMFGRLASSG